MTAGKTLYVTSIILSASSTLLAASQVNILDGAAMKIPTTIDKKANFGSTLSFPEPMRFSTSVVLSPASTSITASVCVVGYEESTV